MAAIRRDPFRLYQRCRASIPRWKVAVLLMVAPAAGRAEPNGLQTQPLAAPIPAREGTKLFELLPAERTGIVTTNAYADPSMWGARNDAFKFGAIGTGIAIGDYDNDGRPDIFVVSKTEPCRLFRNLGDWKFADVTAAAGLSGPTGVLDQGLAWMRGLMDDRAGLAADTPERWKQGAAFADVNNDGWLDLYVCRFGAPNWLYVNQGDGTFKEEAAARGVAVVDASGQAAFCDYDRDGWLDFYLQTNLLDSNTAPTGQPDYLFHNNGDGTFTDVTARAGISGPNQGHAAIWWDYDEDGWPDIYIANDFAPADHLYRNRGDGTFRDVLDAVVPHTPHSSMGADLGDVDNDGHLDLFVADMAATSHEKDHRGMAKVRAMLNDMTEPPGVAPQIMRNALFVNTGRGRMEEAAHLAGLSATDWTWSPRWEDLDNDGRLDLHVTNGMVRELHNADIVRRLSAAESQAAAGRLERGMPPLAEPNLAFHNLGDLRFEEVGAAWGLDRMGVSFGSAWGDLDGDGDLDLVHANYEAGVSVLRNTGTSGHRLEVVLRGTRSNRFGVGATVRIETATGPQVRTLTLARGYLSTSEPLLHFGLGQALRVDRLTVTWPSGIVQSFTDLAVDQKLTIMETGTLPPSASGTIAAGSAAAPLWSDVTVAAGLQITSAERSGPPSHEQALVPRRFDQRAPDLQAADLNGDGLTDLVLGGTTTDSPRVFFATGTGTTFAAPRALPVEAANGPVTVADLTGDGAPDLLFTRSGADSQRPPASYQPELWINDGRGNFSAAPAGVLPSLPLSVGAIAVGDFDRDGLPDLFVGARVQPGDYPLAPASVLLRNTGGRWSEVSVPALLSLGMVTAARWADLDADGWPDLVVATDWGTVRWVHNDAGRSLSDRSEMAGFAAAGAGWWSSLAVADLNGDGRLDVIAGNVGLNTPYAASPTAPLVLLRGDFADSGSNQLIEAYYENDRLLPRRARLELTAVIRSLRRRFPRDDEFAAASLDDILGADRVAAAQRWTTTELRSGVFWAQPNGTYRFEPLPHRAQIAPAMSIVVHDFDDDGVPDLVLGQNDFSPIGAIGRFDGGVSQWLRGDGRRGFTVVAPERSGIVVPGAVQNVVRVVPRAGAPLLIFSRAADSLVALQKGTTP